MVTRVGSFDNDRSVSLDSIDGTSVVYVSRVSSFQPFFCSFLLDDSACLIWCPHLAWRRGRGQLIQVYGRNNIQQTTVNDLILSQPAMQAPLMASQ